MSNRVYRNPAIKSDGVKSQSEKKSIGLSDLDENLRSLIDNYSQSTAKATSVNVEFNPTDTSNTNNINWDELYSLISNSGGKSSITNDDVINLINIYSDNSGGGSSVVKTTLTSMGSWQGSKSSTKYRPSSSLPYITENYSVEWTYEDIVYRYKASEYQMDMGVEGITPQWSVNKNNIVRKHKLRYDWFVDGATNSGYAIESASVHVPMPYNFLTTTPSIHRVISAGKYVENSKANYVVQIWNGQSPPSYIVAENGQPTYDIGIQVNQFTINNYSSLPAQVTFTVVIYEKYDENKTYT